MNQKLTGKINREIFVEIGDALPVSPLDGYEYSRGELRVVESGVVVGVRNRIDRVPS